MKYEIEKEPILKCYVVWKIEGNCKFMVHKGKKKECEKWLKTIK